MSSNIEHDPAPVANGAHLLEIDHGHDAYDALADLFLGDQAPSGPEPFPFRVSGQLEPAHGAGVLVEGVIVGHLPVLVSAWVSQYARHRARELARPIALASVRAGRIRIELFTESPRSPDPFLEDAIATANDAGAAWVVRVDEPDEPRLAESGVDELTLLTGADQAAMVASYRVIKRLSCDLDREGAERVRIAAMGSSSEEAALMGDKIRRAAGTFLGRDVQVAGVIDRIEPGRSSTLFDGPVAMPLEDVIGLLRQGGRTISASTAGARDPVAGLREAAPDSPKPTRDVPPPASHQGPAQLTARVRGLTSIPTSCPYAEGVELARDADGRLHLLASADGIGAVSSLMVAGRWATAHAALLNAAHGALDARTPVLHLFASDVASVRRLLDTDLRVHLLAPIEIDGRRGWFCTALN